jgi:hypothetical protein
MSTKKSTTPKTNLFATAKTEVTAKSNEDKKMVTVTEPEVVNAIDDLVKGREMEKAGKAMQAKAESILKPAAQTEWMNEYKKSNKRPGSFIMANQNNGVLYIVMDSYKKIDEDRATYLKETYGEDIVETADEFIINNEAIEKYAEEISEAIMKIKSIPDEVKLSMFTKRTSFKVAKGTIENLTKIAADNNTTPETLFSEIVPTTQIKVRGDK